MAAARVMRPRCQQQDVSINTIWHFSIGLDWIGLDWIGLDWIGLDWIGLDWIGLDWIGLDWIGLEANDCLARCRTTSSGIHS